MEMENQHPVIIIGTGPSGLTAAIYAARANLSPLVIEGDEPGGQLTLTTEVENFPGFPEGILGPELMDRMKKQAARFGATFVSAKATGVKLKNAPFQVSASNGRDYFGKSIIISTGASAKFLGLPKEKELTGRGVSTCATCDGFFYTDRVVHVVGGGDTAMEEATHLTKYAKSVTVLVRTEKLRASVAMQKRAQANPKIHFLFNHTVDSLIDNESGLKAIVVVDSKTGEKYQRETDGLFLGIGHTPNTGFLNGQIQLNESGFIVTEKGTMRTNIPGVFACGDVQDQIYRQAITAAGSGCQAALLAQAYLEESH